jgi:putative redox protein
MINLKTKLNYQVVSEIRQHQILIDVDAKLGGDDAGMNPHEVLESALAACTAITVEMYAKRKQIKLEAVQVEVHTVSEGKESLISRKLSFVGDLDAEQIKRLTEIADKCPIHKLLESQIKISTEVI